MKRALFVLVLFAALLCMVSCATQSKTARTEESETDIKNLVWSTISPSEYESGSTLVSIKNFPYRLSEIIASKLRDNGLKAASYPPMGNTEQALAFAEKHKFAYTLVGNKNTLVVNGENGEEYPVIDFILYNTHAGNPIVRFSFVIEDMDYEHDYPNVADYVIDFLLL
jgi:hypothetical protein